ncbi:MAG: glycosyltransferase family 4 protein [Methanosarcinales archaeon]|nr:glycosyltransferase family 4 protein [Methanosarcinales archaeon]
MRICFVAYFNNEGGTGDMGTRTVARHLAGGVSKTHEVLRVDVRDIGSWRKAKAFGPDIIHFVFAPTTMGFVAARLFSLYCRGARTVISAPNPTLSCGWLVKHLRPDVILVQSQESEKFFQGLGFNTRFLSNGVDVERFVPATPGQKEQFREMYRIDVEKFVILHVGPVIRKRNIEQLLELQGEDTQVVVVGRRPYDSRLLAELRAQGAVVITEYVERIEEVYALSDAYVFPTDPENRGASIEIPLSVLEAMACNLPVVSTKFGALPVIMKESNEFIFYRSINEISAKSIQKMHDVTKNREEMKSLSWPNIVKKLEAMYCEF